jgi:hypothetical protein
VRAGEVISRSFANSVLMSRSLAALTPQALARLAATRRQHAIAERAWKVSDQPAWLTEQVYAEVIQPRLRAISISAVVSALGISRPYAVAIRLGRRRPHPRHWQTLANLAGVSRTAILSK